MIKINPNSKITHVSCHKPISVKLKKGVHDLKRNLFDGPESAPGILMQLHPAGILCQLGTDTFIIPYASVASCNIDPADVNAAPEKKEKA